MGFGVRDERGEVVVADDPATLAERVADFFVQAAAAAIAERNRFAVALAGGSTPKAAYALLAATPRNALVDWARVLVFFSDERCVPPDDDRSNYRMARETLLGKVDIPPQNVHRMRGEDTPERAAAAYADAVRGALGPEPAFDLILLGMGPDGHTASLFPGTSPATDDRLLINAPFVPKLGSYRLTFTPRLINSARQIVISVAGAEKAATLAEVLQGAYDPNTHPVQIVHPAGGRLTWMVDRAAAGGLNAI